VDGCCVAVDRTFLHLPRRSYRAYLLSELEGTASKPEILENLIRYYWSRFHFGSDMELMAGKARPVGSCGQSNVLLVTL